MPKNKGKRVFTFIDVNEYTPISQLGILDSLHLILQRLLYSRASELEVEDEVTKAYMTLKADCLKFLYAGAKPLREGLHDTATIELSSEFKPVIKDVIKSPKLKRFYKIDVTYPITEYGLDFVYTVQMVPRK